MTKKKLFIIIPIILVIGILTSFIVYNNNADSGNRTFLKRYGWSNILSGQKTSSAPVTLTNEILKSDLGSAEVNASKGIGLNPGKYIGKKINTYTYKLDYIGSKNNLWSTIWTCDKEIICAYIFHSEENKKVRYWALSTPYAQVVEDLKKFE